MTDSPIQKTDSPIQMTDTRTSRETGNADGPLVGLLLAAGRGSRFDALGQSNKLLALVNGQAVAVQSAANLRPHVDHLIIVIKPESAALRQAFSDIDAQLTECADAHLGMGHSLAHGIRLAMELHAPRGVIVALADMPFIQADTYRCLAALTAPRGSADCEQLIAAPRFDGQRGHPVLFGSGHFETLAASRGDTGAPQLLRDPRARQIDVADPGVLRDIDRPADLLEPR